MQDYDVIIIGAGPNGLACAIEAQQAGLSYLIIDKGGICDSIRRFPLTMTFFSTPNLLELGGIPFTTANLRPSRVEALTYYRRIVEYFDLATLLHNRVLDVKAMNPGFEVFLENNRLKCKNIIFATGYYDTPNKLGIPGEELPHVSHYYDEPYRYAASKVIIVGGQNSAVETAIELYRHGVDITLVHRGAKLGDSVKYWVKPDIENRLKEGAIKAYFGHRVEKITAKEITLKNTEGDTRVLPADFVLLLTGYKPDVALLENCGIEVDGESLVPEHNSDSFATNVEGAFLAGSIIGGCDTGSVFIENGRTHAKSIFNSLLLR
jgi:putative YpdA family bacillithiol system oxidoreductase